MVSSRKVVHACGKNHVPALLLGAQRPREQVGEVFRYFDFECDARFYMVRCVDCNGGPLEVHTQEEASGKVPEEVNASHPRFLHCPVCCKYFWKGLDSTVPDGGADGGRADRNRVHPLPSKESHVADEGTRLIFQDRSYYVSTRKRSPVLSSLLVTATSSSGYPIQVVPVGTVGSRCHFDRAYVFMSLGSFATAGMCYVMTCNEDRGTAADVVMWNLYASKSVTVYLNFRSECHVSETGADTWLNSCGWERDTSMKPTVTSGRPSGPYSGPVYSRECVGEVDLFGSNCAEGTYFVFVETAEME